MVIRRTNSSKQNVRVEKESTRNRVQRIQFMIQLEVGSGDDTVCRSDRLPLHSEKPPPFQQNQRNKCGVFTLTAVVSFTPPAPARIP